MDGKQTKELLNLAVAAARGAGEVIMRHYRSSYESWNKSPDNPVTSADLEADYILCTQLTDATPEYGWLSEETSDNPERLDKCCSWVVDPLDGTKEFIQGLDQFAVSIAFVEDGLPLLGVVYNPATKEMITGLVGKGLTYNGETPTPLSGRTDPRGARVLASDTEVKNGMWAPYQKILKIDQVGSAAYKLARVAAGFGDAYISLKPKHEWDVCAGVALVLAAGGQVTDLAGNPLRFNQPNVLVHGVVAANSTLHAQLIELVKSQQ